MPARVSSLAKRVTSQDVSPAAAMPARTSLRAKRVTFGELPPSDLGAAGPAPPAAEEASQHAAPSLLPHAAPQPASRILQASDPSCSHAARPLQGTPPGHGWLADSCSDEDAASVGPQGLLPVQHSPGPARSRKPQLLVSAPDNVFVSVTLDGHAGPAARGGGCHRRWQRTSLAPLLWRLLDAAAAPGC